MVTKATKPRLTVLVHHQYQVNDDEPWVTFKSDAYGPFYSVFAAERFCSRIADDMNYEAEEKPRGDGTTAFVLSSNRTTGYRSVAENVVITPPTGHILIARDLIRRWLNNSYTHLKTRRTA